MLVLPGVVLFRRGRQHPQERRWTITLAGGIGLYVLGNLYYGVAAGVGPVAFPSPADVGYLAIYPAMVAALMLSLRAHLRGVRLIVALDGLCGMLAGAALSTLVTAPLIDQVWDGSLKAATTLAYPISAVVTVAASLGALGIVGLAKGRHFLLWAGGMAVFGLGDIIYAYRVAFDTYRSGMWLDGLSAVGLVFMALGAPGLRDSRQRSLPGARSLIVLAVASVSTVVALAVAPTWSKNPAPSVLALMTLTACACRLTLAFIALRELAAIRLQALTDELTGAANRRALYAELDQRFVRTTDDTTNDGFALMLIDLEHARTRGDMLFAADAAMYAAKTSGETVCCYSPSAVGDRRTRLEVAEDLYSALDRGELTVEYQPIMSAVGNLVGAEALVRWDHPTRGRLSPSEFLDVTERYRLTPNIARRVLDVALADLRRWRSAGNIVRLSVNVSASDLRDETLVDIVAAALLTHGVPPSVLTIEITETAMMSDPGTAQRVMHALDDLGVQLAVDDYGTGYSSLKYLLKLPISEIKLDQAFSAHLVEELRSVAIVRSTVDLTHALGLRMVAEGVENEHTPGILQDLGCDLVQGWHLGRPMPAAAFEAFVTSRDDAVGSVPSVGLTSWVSRSGGGAPR